MKKILLFILLFTNLKIISAQKSKIFFHNEIRIYYAPALSKTNQTCKNCSLFKVFFDAQSSKKPLLGYTLGFDIGRKISPSWGVTLGYRFAKKGQKSPHYYNFYGVPDSSFPPNYGGVSYELVLLTNEFLLKGNKILWKKKEIFSSYLEIGITIDVFHESILRDFIILKDSGIKYPGCCISQTKIYTKGNDFDKLKWHLKDKRFRFGLVIANAYDVKLTKHIFLFLKPELEILSHTINEQTSIQAPIWLLGVQVGLKLSF